MRHLLIALLALASPVAARPQAPAHITVDDLLRIRTPTATAISPDGADVLFSLAEPDLGMGDHVQGIWKVSARGGTPSLLVRRGGTPRWSPDGSRIAYLATSSGNRQLWTMSADGRQQRTITALPLGVIDFAWAPDANRIALIAPIADSAQARGAAGRPQIHVLDLGTGVIRQLTRSSRTIIAHVWDPDANLSWSPDGSTIVFSEKPTPAFDDDYNSDVFVVRVADGAVRPLVQRPGMDMRALWSPDGRHIVFRSSHGKIDRFANHGLAVVRSDGGAPREVGAAFEGGFLDGPYAYGWSPDGSTIYFTGSEPESIAIFAVSVERGDMRRVTSGQALRSAPSFAARADRMAFVMSEPRMPWEVYVSPARSYAPARLTYSNPLLERRALGDGEVVHWSSAGWQGELSGVLITPVGFVAGRRYPVLTLIHGGPEGQAFRGFMPELPSPIFSYTLAEYPVQLYASRGYAVFIPNFRGSGGHGEALRRAGSQDWSRAFLEDILAGIDTLIARGIADSSRLFLAGLRSGATKVVSILTNTTRFRAASVITPYPDLVKEYEVGFRLMHEGLMGGSPTTAAAAYERHSPINGVARIKTPIQVITDEDAFSIPSAQSLTLHERLWRQRVAGELLVYRGRDLSSTAELVRRIMAFFDHWARPASSRN